MARFLISIMPVTGHVHPMLPVAAALVSRGHDVRWHTGLDFAARVQQTGTCFIAFDRTPDFEQIPVVPDPGAKGLAAGVSVLRRLFIDRIPGQVADYETILRDFHAGASALNRAKSEPAGRLRVTVPVPFGRHCIAPVFLELGRRGTLG